MGKGRHTIKVNKRGRKGQGGRNNKKRKTDEAGWDIEEEGKGRRGNWAHSERKNDLFVEYYRNTFGFSDAEWTEFSESLVRDLPTTFRITAHSYFAPLVREKLTSYFQPNLHGVDVGSELLPNVMQFEPLPWYPNGNGWYVRTPRRALKKVEALTQFNQFLINETEVGHTSRQEAVSMIPPIFLQVENHHKVLDMCAAPGSKTTQLIEYLHQGLEPGQIPSGMVVANDVDEQRCYMLVHQVKRIGSPCVMMANYAAQLFPAIRPRLADGSRSDVTFFDRILCDVPCSGDGTLRKNFDLWTKWHPGLGTSLHMLQLRIATRAARLLKVGGRMVYSTCSFNPIEDEAVVAELIRRGKGALEVVDMSAELPGLKRSPGITDWKVYDLVHKSRDTKEKEYKWYSAHSELPEKRQGSIPATCFPPSAEEVQGLHLERCVRVFPHQQDTGGFFITVIQKVTEMPPVPEDEESSKRKNRRRATDTASATDAPAEEAADAAKGKEKVGGEEEFNEGEKAELKTDAADMDLEGEAEQEQDDEEEADDAGLEEVEDEGKDSANKGKDLRRRRHTHGNREEPYLPLSSTLTAEWELVKDYFGLKDTFPELQLMARGEGSPRIYFLSSAVSDVLWKNTSRFSKVVNTGIRMLVKHAPPNAKCHYRPCQEGLEWIYPYMTKRLVTVTFDEMARLVLEETPFLTSFSPETQAQLEPLDAGCCVFVCHVPGKETPMLACGWKARTSAHLLVDKHERRAWTFLLSLKPAEIETEATTATTTTSGTEATTAVPEATTTTTTTTTSGEAESATASSTLALEESAPQPTAQ